MIRPTEDLKFCFIESRCEIRQKEDRKERNFANELNLHQGKIKCEIG